MPYVYFNNYCKSYLEYIYVDIFCYPVTESTNFGQVAFNICYFELINI